MEDPTLICPPDPQHGGGGSGDDDSAERRIIANARVGAEVALRNPDCFKLLSPDDNPAEGTLNPRTVLDRVAINPGPGSGIARVPGSGFGRGTAGGPITVEPLFYTLRYDEQFFEFLRYSLNRQVTQFDMHVFAILHEVGHLTGVNSRELIAPTPISARDRSARSSTPASSCIACAPPTTTELSGPGAVILGWRRRLEIDVDHGRVQTLSPLDRPDVGDVVSLRLGGGVTF